MKYGRILVPLDGSKLAECVLDHVATVAPACGTQEVVLVSVTERVKMISQIRALVNDVARRYTAGKEGA